MVQLGVNLIYLFNHFYKEPGNVPVTMPVSVVG